MGCRAAVAADEAHRRAALALPRVVQEVADDQPEVLQVPVQRLEVRGGLQHHVAQPLHLRGRPRRALGGVGAREFVPEVEDVRLLAGQRGQLVRAGDHPDRDPARVGQVDGDPAEALRQRLASAPGGVGQPQHVGLVRGPERRADEPRPRTAAHEHARRAGVGAAQLQLVGGAPHRGEPERAGERLGAVQVRLLELQPGQVGTLMTGFARPSRVLARQRALLAVQSRCGCRSLRLISDLLRVTDEIVTYDDTVSQEILRNSSELRLHCYRERREQIQQTAPATAWNGASSAPAPR